MDGALLDELATGDASERAESWRYSRNAVRALEQLAFVAADPQAAPAAELHAQFDWPQTQRQRLVFVNGTFAPAQSMFDAAGVAVAHAADGACAIDITADVAQPLHVVHVAIPGATPARWRAALELRVAAGAHVTLVEQHVAAPGADVLGAFAVRVDLAAKAELDLVSLSDLADNASLVRHLRANLAADAALRTTHALFGGRLQRLDFDVALAGERARLESRGVFVLRGREHCDVHLDLRHVARDAACDVLWRGVADQRSRGIFHGAITVEPGADGSDARLSSKNVLLSPLAEIDTKPVLEIHADEVQAAHGAAVGQIDERALFYLRSRGIALQAARRMLVAAFCAEALAGIGDADLRGRIETLAAAHLPAPEASR